MCIAARQAIGIQKPHYRIFRWNCSLRAHHGGEAVEEAGVVPARDGEDATRGPGAMPKVPERYCWFSFWRFCTASWRRAWWALLKLACSLLGKSKPSLWPSSSTQTVGLVGERWIRPAYRSMVTIPEETGHLDSQLIMADWTFW
jgi:hypothetical protein